MVCLSFSQVVRSGIAPIAYPFPRPVLLRKMKILCNCVTTCSASGLSRGYFQIVKSGRYIFAPPDIADAWDRIPAQVILAACLAFG
jgi:hypothetical protein